MADPDPGALPDQVAYLLSLVRMNVRKRERNLANFAPKAGQDPAGAQAVREKFTADLARARAVRDVLETAGTGGGLWAIAQALWAIRTGRVPVSEPDLVTAAMWYLAAEGIRPRRERLALAGALVALEISGEQP